MMFQQQLSSLTTDLTHLYVKKVYVTPEVNVKVSGFGYTSILVDTTVL